MNKSALKSVNRIFWNMYATAYDDISRYYVPYMELADRIEKSFENIAAPLRVLDAGCGTGAMSLRLAGKNFAMDSVDLSEVMLSVLKKKIKKSGIKNVAAGMADLNRSLEFADSSFGAVVNVHSLFMLENIFFTLSEFDRVLCGGGRLVIAHHRPISIAKVLACVFRQEGVIKGMLSMLRLGRVGFFNLFLGKMHRGVYGDIPAGRIIEFLKERGYALLSHDELYNGFDELLILQKQK
jgi:ubiquinone/menaquinone biosynthesis C-methylase UbiE